MSLRFFMSAAIFLIDVFLRARESPEVKSNKVPVAKEMCRTGLYDVK